MSEVVSKRKESPEGARKRLLDSAAELFNTKGYAATTVREIVKAAGVTKPVLYYYFHNKEGIFLELMRETYEKFSELMQSVCFEKGRAREKLERFTDRTFGLFLEEIKTVRLMYSIYYGPHQGAPFFDFDIYHRKYQQAIRTLVEEGIRQEEFQGEDAEYMTWTIIAAINVAIEVELGHSELSLGREGLARVLNLIFRGLGSAGKKMRGKNEK